MPDFLVTGTDTGIGKTIIAAALIKALRAQGRRALGFKPVETGLEEGQQSDSSRLAHASGEIAALAQPLLQLAEPLAPAVAAERAGVTIHPEEIEARIELLRHAGYSLVIEGAGGVMVPLAWEKRPAHGPVFYTVLDLAVHCGLEAIIVGRAGLGTLNHVAMTVEMLRQRHVPVKAVVLNGGRQPPDAAETTNPSVLARMLPDVVILQVPHHSTGDAVDASVPYLSRLL